MVNQKNMKCPACGAAVQATEEICPVCGLKGLQTAVAFEIWEQEILQPHQKDLLPRTFAGNRYGLILTHDGRLYGIGSNESGQIDEQGDDRYSQPWLMAENVISAAAGNHYSIYVTRDAEVHLRGRGELADRFGGFSGAEDVWALSDYGATEQLADAFWIRSREGRVFYFGDNFGIEDQTEPLREDCRFRTEVSVINRVLYQPVPCPGWQWMAESGCRMGSLPVTVSRAEASVLEMPRLCDIQKVFLQAANTRLPEGWQGEGKLALNSRGWLWLRPDGTVEMPYGHHPGKVTEPVTDLSLSENCALLVCRSGEILWNWWHDPGYVFHDLNVGNLNRCRLPA